MQSGMPRSEVRDRIVADHATLRERLDEIESLADRFDKEGADAGDELRELGTALCEIFASHISFEDAQLAPILRERAPGGDVLADRLAREHCEQRELLHYLVARLAEESRPTTVVARELRGFCRNVREDMAHEESTLLAEVAERG